MQGGLKLATLLTQIKVDTDGFKKDMHEASKTGVEEAEKISKKMTTVTKVGEKLSKTGDNLIKGLTLPIIGAGVATTKMAVDFESSFAKVSTLLDDNVVDFGEYKNKLLDASSESKVAVDEFSESVYSSISAGVDQTKAIEFTTDAMKLAKGGFTDGAKAVDVLTTAINGYSLKSEDAARISDLLITTQNLGKTTVDELASSMGAVIPVASASNFGIEELSASYAQLTKNGIATAESGTYLKAMLSELTKSGSIADGTLRELTGKGFSDLKKDGMSTTEILKMLSKEAEKNNKTLKDMFGSVEAGSAALVMYKNNGTEYNEMLNGMESSAGATQAAFEKIDATPAEKLKGSLNELRNSGIKLGASFVPIIEKVSDKLAQAADAFNNLSGEQKNNVIKWGMTLAAVGPVMKVTGGAITTFTKLKGTMGGIGKAFEVLGKSSAVTKTAIKGTATAAGASATSFAGLSATVGPLALGIAGVGVAGYGVYKAMTEEAVPAVDLFEDAAISCADTVGATTVKISENTKKQIGDYVELSNSVQQETTNMYAGVTQVTDEKISEITGKVDEMKNSIIQAAEVQKTETINEFTELFSKSTTITSEEQQQIMNTIVTSYGDRITKTQQLRDELVGIYNNIKENGGNTTEEQQKRMNEIYEEMKKQAVESMSQNEAEQMVILNRLKVESGRVNAETASNAIKEMERLRQENVQKAKDERDQRVMQIELMRGELEKQGKGTADSLIAEANRQYEEVVKAADDTKKKGVEKLEKSYGNLKKEVNTDTGEILTAWQKVKDWWNNWNPEEKRLKAIEQKNGTGGSWSHFNGLDNVPYDGYLAVLHKNERVLTAEENKEYSSGTDKTDYNAIRSIVRNEFQGIVIQLNDREMGRAYSRYAEERR